MNVGKVSFGNTPVAGTTPGATQQASVKKADKSDVVVIGGKEIKKSTLAKGGIIATAAAALGTIAMAAKRGKVVNGDGSKFIQNVTEGFKTFVGKGKEAYKTAVEKAKTAVDGTIDKAAGKTEQTAEATANKTEEVVQDAAANANKGTTEVAEKVEGQGQTAETPKPAPENQTLTAKTTKDATSKVTVEELVKAKSQVEAAEKHVTTLENNIQKALNKGEMITTAPTQPKQPVKPKKPTEVKEPGKVIPEPVRQGKKGKTTKLADIPEDQLSKVEKQRLDSYKGYVERKTAYDEYQTALTKYNNETFPQYETELTQFNTDARQYRVQLGKFQRYQEAEKAVEAAKGRATQAKGTLSTLQKNATKEVKKAASGLSGQTITKLEDQIKAAQKEFDNADTDKAREIARDHLAAAQNSLFEYEQSINK